MLTLAELRKLSLGNLEKELSGARKRLFKHKFEVNTGQSKASHKISENKTYVARILTLLSQYQEKPAKEEVTTKVEKAEKPEPKKEPKKEKKGLFKKESSK